MCGHHKSSLRIDIWNGVYEINAIKITLLGTWIYQALFFFASSRATFIITICFDAEFFPSLLSPELQLPWHIPRKESARSLHDRNWNKQTAMYKKKNSIQYKQFNTHGPQYSTKNAFLMQFSLLLKIRFGGKIHNDKHLITRSLSHVPHVPHIIRIIISLCPNWTETRWKVGRKVKCNFSNTTHSGGNQARPWTIRVSTLHCSVFLAANADEVL